MQPSDTSKLCPSAPAREGAIILGVVQADGSIAYLKDRLKVTREFLEIAQGGRRPEERFRFSSPCQEQACQQWVNGCCRLPTRLAEVMPEPQTQVLPRCSIRAQCRWFYQSGIAACRLCPIVVTRPESRAELDGMNDEAPWAQT
jgi:hypothetical protein